jgi:hypothetical protein
VHRRFVYAITSAIAALQQSKSTGDATIGSLNRSNIGTPGENAGAMLESADVDPVAGAVCRLAVGALL